MFFADKLGPMPGAKGVKGAPPQAGKAPTQQAVKQTQQALKQPVPKAAPAPAAEPPKKKKGWF